MHGGRSPTARKKEVGWAAKDGDGRGCVTATCGREGGRRQRVGKGGVGGWQRQRVDREGRAAGGGSARVGRGGRSAATARG